MAPRLRDMFPSRRSICVAIALGYAAVTADDNIFQSYCSTENTGSDYQVFNYMYQSNGKCHDHCLNNGNYAFAIVQWQDCWCSNYAPADQASVEEDCNVICPGFPDDLCGDKDNGYFGYITLAAQPSGTIGAGGSSSPTSTPQSSSDDPATSPVSGTFVQTVTQTLSESVVTSFVTPTSSSSSTSSQRTTSKTTPPPAPVTSTILQTISGTIVTQTVTSTPIVAPNSNPDNIQIQRKTGLSGGTVAGIVVGVVGGLIILALVAFLLWRRRRRHGSENRDGSVNGSKKGISRNISVLSKAGLIGRGRQPSMAEREQDETYYGNQATGSNSVRHSMMFGGGDAVSPVSPLDSTHSSGSRRPSKPMVYDQRLNPSALFANHEANGSRISMQDQDDYSRPLGIANPDPRPSFESRHSRY